MSNSEIITIAKAAFEDFKQGLATGQWEKFFNHLTDDFTFWFPVGSFQGENIGKEKAKTFFSYVSDKVFTGGLILAETRITYTDNTVVFEFNSQGEMFGHPYQNQGAISLDIRDDKICGYREYLGVLYQIKPNS